MLQISEHWSRTSHLHGFEYGLRLEAQLPVVHRPGVMAVQKFFVGQLFIHDFSREH